MSNLANYVGTVRQWYRDTYGTDPASDQAALNAFRQSGGQTPSGAPWSGGGRWGTWSDPGQVSLGLDPRGPGPRSGTGDPATWSREQQEIGRARGVQSQITQAGGGKGLGYALNFDAFAQQNPGAAEQLRAAGLAPSVLHTQVQNLGNSPNAPRARGGEPGGGGFVVPGQGAPGGAGGSGGGLGGAGGLGGGPYPIQGDVEAAIKQGLSGNAWSDAENQAMQTQVNQDAAGSRASQEAAVRQSYGARGLGGGDLEAAALRDVTGGSEAQRLTNLRQLMTQRAQARTQTRQQGVTSGLGYLDVLRGQQQGRLSDLAQLAGVLRG